MRLGANGLRPCGRLVDRNRLCVRVDKPKLSGFVGVGLDCVLVDVMVAVRQLHSESHAEIRS